MAYHRVTTRDEIDLIAQRLRTHRWAIEAAALDPTNVLVYNDDYDLLWIVTNRLSRIAEAVHLLPRTAPIDRLGRLLVHGFQQLVDRDITYRLYEAMGIFEDDDRATGQQVADAWSAAFAAQGITMRDVPYRGARRVSVASVGIILDRATLWR